MKNTLSKIQKLTLQHDMLTPDIIKEKDVKIGLRNADGSGVVVGMTTKGRVVGYKVARKEKGKESGGLVPVEGKLYYCGYDVIKMVEQLEKEKRFGFEETAYLLLTGELPGKSDLNSFAEELARRRALSKAERRIIMEEVQNDNQMYALHSAVSHMSRFDANPDSIDIKDVSRQCINLIAKLPTVVATNYNVVRFSKGADLTILRPRPELSTAENFLYLIKGHKPDDYEARLFDISLVLHAEHGGGNNSTFSVRTVSSSGANTYMAVAAGLASLSGHLHGGANEHVMLMMKDLKKNVKDWESEKQVRAYLQKVFEKKANDRTGKIYGFGHAVYTLSDPRAVILKKHAEKFAAMKGATDEFKLYDLVQRIATELLSERKGAQINANVDFYSGFINKLLGIPRELFTPIFAMARVVGWSAHRLEQIIQGKIMRPTYISSYTEEKEYMGIRERR